MIKKLSIFSVLVLSLISGCANTNSGGSQEQWTPNFVTVKYRADPVDIAAGGGTEFGAKLAQNAEYIRFLS